MSISVKRKKARLGFIYGIVAGLAFAIFTWGIDAFLLAQANTAYYWIKFIPGFVVCTLASGLVGWLTVHYEKHGHAVVLWGSLGILFSWLAIWLPFTGSLDLIRVIDPDLAQFFDFSQVKDLSQFRLVSMVVVGLASILCGLLEINLIQQALVASHGLSTLMALLVCIFFFGIAGSAIDQMINTNLREPIQQIDKLIQFAIDNQGKDVPKQTARKMHLSAVNRLDGIIRLDRKLSLIGYDENLGVVDTLVNFEGTLVQCTTIYAQPTDCIIIPQNP